MFLTVDKCKGVSLSTQSRSVSIVRVTALAKSRFSADWLKPSSTYVYAAFIDYFPARSWHLNVTCDFELTSVGYRRLCAGAKDEY